MLKNLDWKHVLQILLAVASIVFEYLAQHASDGSLPFHVSAAFCFTMLNLLGLVSKSILQGPAQMVAAASAQLTPESDSVHAQVKPMLDQAVAALEAAK